MAKIAVKPKFELPAEVSQPSNEIGDYTWLIYGERKIGKTSLAAQFEDAMFMMFEPGGKGLSVYQAQVPTWEAFKELATQLKETDRFRTIVIDTVDIAYERASAYVGKTSGFTHPGEMNDYGKSWDDVRREFSGVINEIVGTGRGVMFISHAKEREFKSESGAAFNKWVPTMSNQARTFVTGFVDVIAYYGYSGTERILTIRGSDMIDAGHRLVDRFRVKNEDGTDEPIYAIPMGNSPKEGYENILAAFENRQEDTYQPDVETAVGSALTSRLKRRLKKKA